MGIFSSKDAQRERKLEAQRLEQQRRLQAETLRQHKRREQLRLEEERRRLAYQEYLLLQRRFEALRLEEQKYLHKPLKINWDAKLVLNLAELAKEFRCSFSTESIASNVLYKLVELKYWEKDFKEISKLFRRTNKRCFEPIKIERIENPYLLALYHLKREQYESRNEDYEEKLLFHGTKRTNIQGICTENFNWRKRGDARGHIFGQGVSFTPISNYATHYSDKTFEKIMFVARVIVGRECIGNVNMVVPPEPYDTSIKPNGHVVVKYEDNTFYPEFLIHYEGIDTK